MGISKVSLDGVTQIDITSSTVTPSHLYVNSTAVDAAGNNIEGGAQADNEDALLERTISGTYYNDTITSIGTCAFHQSWYIDKLIVPNVTTIGLEGCYYMTGLEEADIPKLQSLGNLVFYGCTKLKKVNGIENLTTLPRYTFYNCTSLESISLPNCTSVSSYVFYGCTALQTVNLENCYSLGSYAFYNCTSLKNINIPNVGGFDNNSTTAADQFYGCTALESISLPKVIYDAGAVRAFTNCTSLKTVNMPNCLGFSGNSIFQNCTSLEGIVLPYWGGHNGPSTTFDIYNSYFRWCQKLKYIDIRTPTNIQASAFEGCRILDTVIIRGDRVTGLSNITAFSGSPFASDSTGGTLYVPAAQISAYQAATNWSTILGYANNSIISIEGSQYENYYADGTALPTEKWDRCTTQEFKVRQWGSFWGSAAKITIDPTSLSWNARALTSYAFYTWGEIKTGYKVKVEFDYLMTGNTTGGLYVVPEVHDVRNPAADRTRFGWTVLNILTENGSGHYSRIQDPLTIANVTSGKTITDALFYQLAFYAYTGAGSHVEIKNIVFEVSPTDTVLEEEE